MNARNQPQPDTTPQPSEPKAKQRDPLLVAASLAAKLGKAKAALASAEAIVAKKRAELSGIENNADPAVLAQAKKMLAG